MDENTIVVGVDGSQPSHLAVRWAANRAERCGSRLLLVHAVGDTTPLVSDDELVRDARHIAETAAPSVVVETELVIGDPVWSLADGYPSARAIVVGSHKTGFLRGSSFGSRSLQLASVSTTPVIVVPSSADSTSTGSTSTGVVLGLDESPDGRAALDVAVRFAREEHQALTVVRCVPASTGRRGGEEETRAAGVLAEARRRVRALAPGMEVRTRVVHGSPAQALIRASARASLLVVGRSQGTGYPSPMGRVTHDVLLNLVAPTAVVGSSIARTSDDAHDAADGGTFDSAVEATTPIQ